MKDEVWHALIVVITNASDLHGYAVRSFYRAVQTAGEQVLRALPVSSIRIQVHVTHEQFSCPEYVCIFYCNLFDIFLLGNSCSSCSLVHWRVW